MGTSAQCLQTEKNHVTTGLAIKENYHQKMLSVEMNDKHNYYFTVAHSLLWLQSPSRSNMTETYEL